MESEDQQRAITAKVNVSDLEGFVVDKYDACTLLCGLRAIYIRSNQLIVFKSAAAVVMVVLCVIGTPLSLLCTGPHMYYICKVYTYVCNG